MSADIDDSTEMANQSIISHDETHLEAEAEASIDEPKNKEMFYKVAFDYEADSDNEFDLTEGDIIKV